MSCGTLNNLPPSTSPNAMQATGLPVQATVRQGILEGRSEDGLRLFYGIPYAAPPVGPLRWKAPQAAASWDGVRDASVTGSMCPQKDEERKGYSVNEDCLYLNVVAPENVSNAPVMVWVHGGSFSYGSGNYHDARVLAREQGVVVVTLNYRLGALGFMAAQSLQEGTQVGNYGLLDQQAALRWVRQNIGTFGGNPQNVTAFGLSAGAMSLCQHLTAPSSAGLFDKVIMQSGPCTASTSVAPLNEALKTGAKFASALGCSETDAACLRSVPVEKILSTAVPGASSTDLPFKPLYGDALLPQPPLDVLKSGAQQRLPTLLGTTRDEGRGFVNYLTVDGMVVTNTLLFGYVLSTKGLATDATLRRYPASDYATTGLRLGAILTDQMFACPTFKQAQFLSAAAPTYLYEFRDRKAPTNQKPTVAVPDYGAQHMAEAISVFGTPYYFSDPAQFSAAQQQLAQQVRQYWGNFARTGQPNQTGLPAWPALNSSGNVQYLDVSAVEQNNGFWAEHRCDLW